MSADHCLLYVTCSGPHEAETIARALIKDRLAACANIIPQITALFEWQDNLETATESILILKTQTRLAETATQAIRMRHAYECPCILQLPITSGNPDFLNWITHQTTSP